MTQRLSSQKKFLETVRPYARTRRKIIQIDNVINLINGPRLKTGPPRK